MTPRQIGLLLLLAGLALGLPSALEYGLSPRIAHERLAADERALLDLLPADSYDNRPLARPISLPDSPLPAWLATRQGAPVAVLLPSTAQGYEGPIRLLVAVDPQGRLLGVKVLEQQETPGIGDRIEAGKSAWLSGFIGKSLVAPPPPQWRVRADEGAFDQIAGATITSRAVVAAVQQTLQLFDRQRALLLPPPAETVHE